MRSGDAFIGVPMGRVFELAGEFSDLPLAEIEELLESDIHEARAGAVKVLALRAAARGAREQSRTESFELYLRRHDRIDSWDLVDLGAPYIVGPYLFDKPRDLLDRLAASESPWERRTALYATIAFVRTGQVDDAFRIAERLIDDPHDSVQKAVGTVLRTAGDRAPSASAPCSSATRRPCRASRSGWRSRSSTRATATTTSRSGADPEYRLTVILPSE